MDAWSTVEIRFLWVQQKNGFTLQCHRMWQSARYHSAPAAALTCAWAQVFKALEIRQAIQGTWLRNRHIPHKQSSALLLQCTLNYALADVQTILRATLRDAFLFSPDKDIVCFVLFLPFYGFSFNYILGHACWLTQILSFYIYYCKRN